MSHLHLPATTTTLLNDLLNRPWPEPTGPTLPSGPRTTEALARAVELWRNSRRRADHSLREHLLDIRRFALRTSTHDFDTARRFREVLR